MRNGYLISLLIIVLIFINLLLSLPYLRNHKTYKFKYEEGQLISHKLNNKKGVIIESICVDSKEYYRIVWEDKDEAVYSTVYEIQPIKEIQNEIFY